VLNDPNGWRTSEQGYLDERSLGDEKIFACRKREAELNFSKEKKCQE